MEGEDALPVRRRVARMTKPGAGEMRRASKVTDSLGGDVLSVGPKRPGGESASVHDEVMSQCGKFKPGGCADVADEGSGKYRPNSHAIRARRGVVRGQLAASDPAEGVQQLSAGRPAPHELIDEGRRQHCWSAKNPDERMEIASMIDDDPPRNPLAQPFTRSRAWPRFST
jgi:hypothetical protein